MMEERNAKMTILLGTNGTGKTTLLRQILENCGQKVLVITPDDAEWTDCSDVELNCADDYIFTGIRRHIFNPDKENGTLQRIALFKKGVLVFDDCRGYLKANTSDEIRLLLIRRRQREVDIFAVGHGFTEVPPVFFTFSTDIFLFRTTDEIERRKYFIKNFENIKQEQIKVNRNADKNPHYFKYIKFV